MRQFLLKIIGYGFIALCCVQIVAWGSLYFLGRSSFYKPLFITNHPQQNFDYIILGSSTGLTTLDSKLIDSITGFSGINLSIDDTSLSSHYLMLKHFTEIGKKSNRCVLTISYGDIANKSPLLSGNDYRFLPLVSKGYVQEYYNAFESKEASIFKTSKYIPFVGVGYYNAEIFYPSLVSITNPSRRNRFDNRGNYVYPSSRAFSDRDQKKIMLELNNPFLEKIVSICKENDMELILYHPPIYKRGITYNGTKYKFINHSTLIEDQIFFYDNIHVNRKGRKLASQNVASELRP